MRLLLCEPHDTSALWVLRELRAQDLEVEFVTSADLARARRWEHRIEDGAAWTAIELGDGRRIDSRAVRGVLNRVETAGLASLARAAPADRDYAIQELWAFWTSWLESLPDPVLNRPARLGLSGPWLHGSEWLVLAAAAGLATPPYRAEDGAEPVPPAPAGHEPLLIVVSGAVVGPPAPDAVLRGCQELSRAASCELLGVSFRNGWEFAGATPLPDLRRGGRAIVDVLARALGGAA
jgi:hypothetical protein